MPWPSPSGFFKMKLADPALDPIHEVVLKQAMHDSVAAAVRARCHPECSDGYCHRAYVGTTKRDDAAALRQQLAEALEQLAVAQQEVVRSARIVEAATELVDTVDRTPLYRESPDVARLVAHLYDTVRRR